MIVPSFRCRKKGQAMASRRSVSRQQGGGPAGKQRNKEGLGRFCSLLPDVVAHKGAHAGIAHGTMHALRTALCATRVNVRAESTDIERLSQTGRFQRCGQGQLMSCDVPLGMQSVARMRADLERSGPAAKQQVHEVVEQLETDRRQLARRRAAAQRRGPVAALSKHLAARNDWACGCTCESACCSVCAAQ